MSREIKRGWQGHVLLPGAISMWTGTASGGRYVRTTIVVNLAARLVDQEAAEKLEADYGAEDGYYRQRVGMVDGDYDSTVTVSWLHYDPERDLPPGHPQHYCTPHFEGMESRMLAEKIAFLRWFSGADAGTPHHLVAQLLRRGFVLTSLESREFYSSRRGQFTDSITVRDKAAEAQIRARVAADNAWFEAENAEREAKYERDRASKLAESIRDQASKALAS